MSAADQSSTQLLPKAGELVKRGLLKSLDLTSYEPNQRVVDEALGLKRASMEANNGPECPEGRTG